MSNNTRDDGGHGSKLQGFEPTTQTVVILVGGNEG
jgi:hypothetical protein